MKEFISLCNKIGSYFININHNVVYSHNDDIVIQANNVLELPSCSIIRYEALQLLSTKDQVKNAQIKDDTLELDTVIGIMRFRIIDEKVSEMKLKELIYNIDPITTANLRKLMSIYSDISIVIEKEAIVCSAIDYTHVVQLSEEYPAENLELNRILQFNPSHIEIYRDEKGIPIIVGVEDDIKIYQIAG